MTPRWEGDERRAHNELREDEIEAIAERAANKAIEKVYTAVGKSVVRKVLFLAGAGAIAVVAWMNGWHPPK